MHEVVADSIKEKNAMKEFNDEFHGQITALNSKLNIHQILYILCIINLHCYDAFIIKNLFIILNN